MHRQDGRRGPRGWPPRSSAAPARGELIRSPQPQPIGITCPKRSATSGGTSRIGPAGGLAHVRMRADSRRRPTMLDAAPCWRRPRMPSRASTSSAHSERSLIDHSGARNAATRVDAGGARAPRRCAADPRRTRSGRARRRACGSSRASRSRGRPRRISPTSAGCRSATQPRTKNVARAPARSSTSSSRRVVMHDARRQRVPVVGRERAVHAADVKPLFDIDREHVRARSPALGGRRSRGRPLARP